MQCINCGSEMSKIGNLKEYVGNEIKEVDICTNCNHIWFDGNEQAFINKDSLINLSKELLEIVSYKEIQNPDLTKIKCPRCKTGLISMSNLTNGQPFTYFMCPKECGLFMSFEDFFKLHGLVKKPRNEFEQKTYDDNKLDDWEKSSIEYNIAKLVNEEEK